MIHEPYELWAVWGHGGPNPRGFALSAHPTFEEAQTERDNMVVMDTGLFDQDAQRGEFGELLILKRQEPQYTS